MKVVCFLGCVFGAIYYKAQGLNEAAAILLFLAVMINVR
jgi:hypothetical protein